MPGLNTTGRATPKDYSLGRGKVYFAEHNSSNRPKGYRHLGNATEFNITVESETLPHNSSQEGLKTVDKEVVVSQKISLSLTVDEINFQNLALFSSGSTAFYTNGTPDNTSTVPSDENTGPGTWYDIYDEDGARCYDVASVAFSGHGTPAVDTDYLIDKIMGRFSFIVGGAATGVAAGSTITYQATMAAASPSEIDEVRGLTTTSINGSLKFIAENPVNNDHQTEFEFHSVSLKAEGDFGLISDEYTTMTLTGAAEKNAAAGSVGSPTLTIRTYEGGTSQ